MGRGIHTATFTNRIVGTSSRAESNATVSASPVCQGNVISDMTNLDSRTAPRTFSRVEGVIEPEQAEFSEAETSFEEEEESNDNALRSVQVLAAQTTRAVVLASRKSHPYKRTRGDVCCRKLINLMPGEKLHVNFDKDCRPVGENSSIYTFFLGQTVRNRTCCPLRVDEWKNMEVQHKELAWNVVLEKFTMDQPEIRKEYILRHMNALYRDYRHKLKAKYYDDEDLFNQPQREKNKPKKVMQADWLFLCRLWHSPEFKKISKKNRENKALQKLPHYSGTKSFARLGDELRKKNKREPSRAEILMASRDRKSSKPVDMEKLASNKKAVTTIENYLKERTDGKNEMSDEQIFKEALGEEKNGYLRAYGRNKSITDHFGIKPSRLTLANKVIEVEQNTDKRVEEIGKQMEEKMEEKLAQRDMENEKKLEERDKENEKKLAERDRIWEERFRKLSESIGTTFN